MGFRSSRKIWIGGIGSFRLSHYKDDESRCCVSLERLQTQLREHIAGVGVGRDQNRIRFHGWSIFAALDARADGERAAGGTQKADRFTTRFFSRSIFWTFGIPLLSGRDFNEHDTDGHPLVA